MGGSAQHLSHVALLDDFAVLHDDYPVSEVGDDPHVMGDEENCRAEAVAKVTKQIQNLSLHRDIQRGGWLVGNEQSRVAAQ